MNTTPCGKCVHFDPIMKNVRGKFVPIGHRGWCVKLSTYPVKEQEGQAFPDNAIRAKEGEMAKPKIVMAEVVLTGCVYGTPRG